MRLEHLLEAGKLKPSDKSTQELLDELDREEAAALGHPYKAKENDLSPEDQYAADSMAPATSAQNFVRQATPQPRPAPDPVISSGPAIVPPAARTGAGPAG